MAVNRRVCRWLFCRAALQTMERELYSFSLKMYLQRGCHDIVIFTITLGEKNKKYWYCVYNAYDNVILIVYRGWSLLFIFCLWFHLAAFFFLLYIFLFGNIFLRVMITVALSTSLHSCFEGKLICQKYKQNTQWTKLKLDLITNIFFNSNFYRLMMMINSWSVIILL